MSWSSFNFVNTQNPDNHLGNLARTMEPCHQDLTFRILGASNFTQDFRSIRNQVQRCFLDPNSEIQPIRCPFRNEALLTILVSLKAFSSTISFIPKAVARFARSAPEGTIGPGTSGSLRRRGSHVFSKSHRLGASKNPKNRVPKSRRTACKQN